MLKHLVILLTLFALATGSRAQTLATLEADMSTIAPKILKGETDSIRNAANTQFITLLEKALNMPESFSWPFDSLLTIARLQPDDKSFRIFNWNLPKGDGTFAYFGYVQMTDPKGMYKVVKLIDKSDEIQAPENKALSAKNWYGMHYYKIIQTTYKKTKTYTLLGIDFNNRMTRKKIIDVISFDRLGNIWFGDNIFLYEKKTPKRIIFEYSATAIMSLRYEDMKGMIVFDHLSPSNPSLVGQYQDYGPDFSYDGLKFKKGKWLQVIDVDARNPKTVDDNVKFPKPGMGLDGNAPNPDTQ